MSSDCIYILGIPIRETDECRKKRKAAKYDHKEAETRAREHGHTDRTDIRNNQQALSDIAKNYGTGTSPGEATASAAFGALGTAAPGITAAIAGAIDPAAGIGGLLSAGTSAATTAATSAVTTLSDPSVAVPLAVLILGAGAYFVLSK